MNSRPCRRTPGHRAVPRTVRLDCPARAFLASRGVEDDQLAGQAEGGGGTPPPSRSAARSGTLRRRILRRLEPRPGLRIDRQRHHLVVVLPRRIDVHRPARRHLEGHGEPRARRGGRVTDARFDGEMRRARARRIAERIWAGRYRGSGQTLWSPPAARSPALATCFSRYVISGPRSTSSPCAGPRAAGLR